MEPVSICFSKKIHPIMCSLPENQIISPPVTILIQLLPRIPLEVVGFPLVLLLEQKPAVTPTAATTALVVVIMCSTQKPYHPIVTATVIPIATPMDLLIVILLLEIKASEKLESLKNYW